MNKEQIRIAYDGEAVADGSMDVNELAPALLAVGELCQAANKSLNGDQSKLSVNVKSDFSKGSFIVDLDVVQTFTEQAKMLIFGTKEVSPSELLQFLGFSTSSVVGGGVGLFKLIKWLKGENDIERTTLENGDIKISVKGDNNSIIVEPQTNQLYEDANIRKSVKGIVRPLQREGIEKFKVLDNSETIQTINKKDVPYFECLDVIEDTLDYELDSDGPQTVKMWVTVFAPVYEKDAKKWRFNFGDIHEYMDISETDIVKKAFERGGALINDAYQVDLEISQKITETGNIKNIYKIKEVLDFRPAEIMKQRQLPFGKQKETDT